MRFWWCGWLLLWWLCRSSAGRHPGTPSSFLHQDLTYYDCVKLIWFAKLNRLILRVCISHIKKFIWFWFLLNDSTDVFVSLNTIISILFCMIKDYVLGELTQIISTLYAIKAHFARLSGYLDHNYLLTCLSPSSQTKNVLKISNSNEQ